MGVNEEGVYEEGVNLVLELSSNFYIFSLSTSIVLIKTDVLRVRELPNPKISEPKIALFLLNYLQRGFIIKDGALILYNYGIINFGLIHRTFL